MSFLKSFFSSLVFVFVSLNSFCQAWELKEDKDGIKIYTRKIEGSSVKEFRGEIVVHSNLGSILALIDDVSSYPKWMHNCSYAERVKKISKESGYTYYVLKAPWPVIDRDSYVYYEVTQDLSNKAVTIAIKGIKDYLPKKDGRVRIPTIKGFWQLSPIKKGITHVVYQLHCESGGFVPAAIVNAYITETPYYNLLRLKKTVESPNFPKIVMKEVKELE